MNNDHVIGKVSTTFWTDLGDMGCVIDSQTGPLVGFPTAQFDFGHLPQIRRLIPDNAIGVTRATPGEFAGPVIGDPEWEGVTVHLDKGIPFQTMPFNGDGYIFNTASGWIIGFPAIQLHYGRIMFLKDVLPKDILRRVVLASQPFLAAAK